MVRTALARNAVQTAGDGAPMLLAHGFGCDQSMWKALAALLPGYKLITYDLTGMGSSDYNAYDRERHGTLDGHSDDLIEILDELNLGPVVAVGHSVSSMIIGLAAIKRPDLFGRLVMLGPSPCYQNKPPYIGGFEQADIEGLLGVMRDNYQGWAGQLASMVAGGAPETEDTLKQRFCKNDPEISAHFARVTFTSDNREDVARIKVPTLVIRCKDDALAPDSVAQFMLEKLPKAEAVIIPGSGHAPHMTHPLDTAKAVQRFLSS